MHVIVQNQMKPFPHLPEVCADAGEGVGGGLPGDAAGWVLQEHQQHIIKNIRRSQCNILGETWATRGGRPLYM
jgi:hypothetical protein